jgi:hypothetical protein
VWLVWTRHSLASIATVYELDRQGSIRGRGNIFFLHTVQTGYGANESSYPVDTGEAVSPGVKRQGRESDHQFLSSAEVKNCGAKRPLPLISSWLAALLIKHRIKFVFFPLPERLL